MLQYSLLKKNYVHDSELTIYILKCSLVDILFFMRFVVVGISA